MTPQPEPQNPGASRWGAGVGLLLSVVLSGVIVAQLGPSSHSAVAAVLHLPAVAWLAFAAQYAAQPVGDFLIFRRLWRLPLGGLRELVRKNVINEVVLGYSGEAYLYLWARRQADLGETAFAAVKDVSLLSALTGNALTLLLCVAVAGQLEALDLAVRIGPAVWLGAAPFVVSVAILAFGRQAFSLPARDLVAVSVLHSIRFVVAGVLAIAVWWLALPQTPWSVWVLLFALRLLVSRIPFLTNKELIFGNLVLLLVGARTPAGQLLAGLAIATLAAHLMAMVALIPGDIASRREPSRLGAA